MPPIFHTHDDCGSYSGAVVSELPSLFGVRLLKVLDWPGDYATWVRGEAPLLPRERLGQLLLRVFWKTVAPAKYTSYRLPYHAREPLNIHSWFRLIEHLVSRG